MALLKSVKEYFIKDRKDLSANAPDMFLNCCEFIPELPKLKSKGQYPAGVPQGLIIHYTAGNRDQSAHSAIQSAFQQNHSYFFIDAKGTIYQQFDLNKWGSHAGESFCPVTERKNISKYYVGVEVACAGKLNFTNGAYYTWFGKMVSPHEVRYFDGNETQIHKGHYQKFTIPQEQALMTLSLALIKIFGISIELIMGHDEVSPMRKSDPAGSLSCSMSEFRNILRSKVSSNSVF
jgi:N-acetylmuramoyl-L-alanine amidase